MRSRFAIRLMSTRCAGRASLKLSSGTSDWPPASTFASSSDASSAHASSTDRGTWYSKRAGFTSFEYGDGAARRRLAALEAPWKAAERDLPVEHLVDSPAQVFDVDDVVRKEQRVHDLVVGFRKDLVEAPAQLLLRVLRLVGADAADDGVHGVVGAAGVDRDPAHAALQHPLGKGAIRAGVADEVFRLIDLRTVRPVLGVVAVISGVDDEDVAALDPVAGVLLPALEVFRPIQVEVAEAHAFEIDDAGGADEEVEREVADELAAGQEVRRCIQVGADVHRHRDLLAAGLVERQPLDPADGRPRVTGEGGGVEREVLGEVDESQLLPPSRTATRSPAEMSPIGSPDESTTGRCRMPSRIIFSATTATSSSGPIVAGSTVMIRAALVSLGSRASAMARTRSRSVTIPTSRPSDMTAAESAPPSRMRVATSARGMFGSIDSSFPGGTSFTFMLPPRT